MKAWCEVCGTRAFGRSEDGEAAVCHPCFRSVRRRLDASEDELVRVKRELLIHEAVVKALDKRHEGRNEQRDEMMRLIGLMKVAINRL